MTAQCLQGADPAPQLCASGSGDAVPHFRQA